MGETPRCSLTSQRIIGRLGRAADGAVLICVGGVHGNEQAGVAALKRVVERLEREARTIRGELVAVVGNMHAGAHGERFIDADLNRIWRAERIGRLAEHRGDAPLLSEEAELLELKHLIDDVVAKAPGPVFFLDLHTTSGASVPFAVIGDTLPNRDFALHFPVPVILGLEEQVTGTLPEYAYGLGCVTMGFESGQHDDPRSIDLHEAAVWVALHAAGMLPAEACDVNAHRKRLESATSGTPRFLEVRQRHGVSECPSFEMVPGFQNFQRVEEGQLLARDAQGEIRAPAAARILLPLYQQQGEDGFFLARPVRPFWLRLSKLVRRLGMGAIAPWLPGVRRHPQLPNAVHVDPHVARWYVVEVFHLLGYRQRAAENGRLIFARRDFDIWQRKRR